MCQNVTTDLLNRDYLEFMQYTGLKDENGKEIYEGDIVKSYGDNKEDCFIGEIVWNNFECCFEIRKELYESQKYEICPLHGLFNEILGTVYENLDLLEDIN